MGGSKRFKAYVRLHHVVSQTYPIGPEERDLHRQLGDLVPWSPRVGDTYMCGGFPKTVWSLPAPCHPEDFKIWSLHDAKNWLNEHGVSSLEIARFQDGWRVIARQSGGQRELIEEGRIDVEAILRVVLSLATQDPLKADG